MSLDVNAMVRVEQMESTECILCGTCVDNCPGHAIRYGFSAGEPRGTAALLGHRDKGPCFPLD